MSMYKISSKLKEAARSFTFNQVMLRIKDPSKSIPFYEKYLDMTLIVQKDFSDFSLYFLVTLPEEEKSKYPKNSDEANKFLKDGDYGCCLELTHNHGTENDDSFSYHNGQTAPFGFISIGFLVDDIKKTFEKLTSAGVQAVSEPKESYHGGLSATVKDPDGYLVDLHARSHPARVTGRATFHDAGVHVKDWKKSLEFYQEVCGMSLVKKIELSSANRTLFFLSKPPSLPSLASTAPQEAPTASSGPSADDLLSYPGQLVRLECDHSVEGKEEVSYHSGNEDPRGFGHFALMVTDVYEAAREIEEAGAKMQKRPDEGRMKGLAFAKDPDGYWIELVKRGVLA